MGRNRSVTSRARTDTGEHRSTDVGVVLGMRSSSSETGFGFAATPSASAGASGELLRGHLEAHGLVLAATGAGKFVNVIAPNILAFEGAQLYVADPKGEATQVTRRERARRGPTFVLDPFGVVSTSTDSLNPLDLLRIPGGDVESDAEMLAWELASGLVGERDPYWIRKAVALVAGLIASAGSAHASTTGTLGWVTDRLVGPDPVLELAHRMDDGEIRGEFGRARVAEFLQTPAGTSSDTRGCVLSFAQQLVHPIQSEKIRRALGPSSFSLADVVDGEKPLTVYMVFPPTKARSHRGLLHLWLSTLMFALSARPRIPSRRTLVVIDEAANLGRLEYLPMMHTYLRGSGGGNVLTAWQSLGQLIDLYPTDWRTIVENCGVIQAFGLHTTAVGPVSELLGVPPEVLRRLGSNEQLVARAGAAPEVLTRIDYRTDAMFRKCLVSPNPRYVRDR
jgi:type IV secretion system protein VirD4